MIRKLMAQAAIAALLLVTSLTARAQDAGDPLDKVATYDFGQSRAPLMKIEELSRQADQKAKIEAAMIKVLQDDKATFAGKQFACRMLRLVGTEQSVPALAALLSDEKLSHMARWALQMMPFPAVDAALESALGSVKGDPLIGVVTTIGARKDAKAVAKLAELAGGADAKLALPAIASLGQIGGSDAAKALAALKPADEKLAPAVADARLLAADSLVASGKADEAKATYEALYDKGCPELVRVMALRGIAKTGQAQAIPALLEAIKGELPKLSAAAVKYSNDIPGAEMTKALTEALPQLAPKTQVQVATALMTRGDKSAAEAVAKLLGNADDDVKIAAAKALVAIGGPAQVGELAKASLTAGPAGDAAVEALGLVHGEGVSAAVRELMGSGDAALREKAIAAIEARRDAEAIPGLIKAMQDSERKVKLAAAKALGAVAGEKDIPALADMLVASKSENERGALEKALVAAASRAQNKDALAETLVGKMSAADNAAKGSLMVVLAGLTGPKAYDAISGQIKSSDVELKKAAIRALSTWPEKKAAPDLLEVAKGDADAVCKVLALRGYVSIATQATDATAAERVKMLKDALAIAEQRDAKSQILSGLAKVPDAASLKLVEPFLGDAELASEAQIAYIQIAAGLRDKNAGIAAIEKIQALNPSDAVKRQATQALQKLNRGGKASTAKAGKAGRVKAGKGDAKAGKNGKGERKGRKQKAATPAVQ